MNLFVVQQKSPMAAFPPATRHSILRLVVRRNNKVLRAAGAKFVWLARRERNQTPNQTAALAEVRLGDVLALEQGRDVPPDVIERVADILQIDAEILLQLFGRTRAADAGLLKAATEFIGRLEAVEPLSPSELEALGAFRSRMQPSTPRGVEVHAQHTPEAGKTSDLADDSLAKSRK